MDTEKVVKELHDARRYLEDKEWSDRGASPHIDAINDAIALLKEQETKEQLSDAAHETAKQFRQTIVRCKDCTWWGTDRMCENSDSPCFQNGCTHGNWFCADGERKDSN